METQELINEYYSDPPKTELIDGIVYNMAAGTTRHADIVSNILAMLYSYFRRKTCRPYTSELEIQLDDKNIFRPDISVICDFSKGDGKTYKGAPALVIEVISPSTAKNDRVKKFNVYQSYGVAEYWIVFPEYNALEQYALIDGVFKLLAIHVNVANDNPNPPNPYHYGTSFNSYVYTDLEIDLDDVFRFYLG
jgi:Uma2 family endonuclease